MKVRGLKLYDLYLYCFVYGFIIQENILTKSKPKAESAACAQGSNIPYPIKNLMNFHALSRVKYFFKNYSTAYFPLFKQFRNSPVKL